MAIVSKGDLGRLGKLTATANGTSAVVVSYPTITDGSQVLFTLKTQSGTAATANPFVSAITPGTGFSFKSTAGDTSVYNIRVI